MNQMMNFYLPVNSPRATNDQIQASGTPQVQQPNDRDSLKLRKKESFLRTAGILHFSPILMKKKRFENYSFLWGGAGLGL